MLGTVLSILKLYMLSMVRMCSKLIVNTLSVYLGIYLSTLNLSIQLQLDVKPFIDNIWGHFIYLSSYVSIITVILSNVFSRLLLSYDWGFKSIFITNVTIRFHTIFNHEKLNKMTFN